MKRKITFSILCLLAVVLSLSARSRTATEALDVARSFYEKREMLRSVSDIDFRLAYTSEGDGLRSTSGAPYFYVFNVGEEKGFILVSAEDRTRPILGYSTSGAFNPSSLPSNMRAWLDEYNCQIDYARTLPERPFPTDEPSLRSDDGFPEQVAPMIQSKWDQGAPYNNLCPMDGDKRSLTGCAATAAAQVMNYHQWPVKAEGKGAYRLNGEKVEVDLSVFTFDWKNMSNTYNSTSTAEQNKAVAELMYAAGASSVMQYSAIASGTLSEFMAQGLIHNLGYDKNLVCLHRNFYATADWKKRLKDELSNKRPVIYGASAHQGGHAFVCDGYDKDGLFHINWGWGGHDDAFFELDLLNPFPVASGYGGFSFSQTMIVGIQKPTETSVPYHSLNLLAINMSPAIRQGDTLYISSTTSFESSKDEEIETSLGLFTDEGVYRIYEKQARLMPTVTTLIENGTLYPFSLDPGVYKLKYLYRMAGEKEWREVAYANRVNMDIKIWASDSQIQTFLGESELYGTRPISADMDLISNKVNVLRSSIRNGANIECNSPIFFRARSLDTDTFYTISQEGIYLQPGEEKEIAMQAEVNLAPGVYAVAAYCVDAKSYYSLIEGTQTIMTVLKPTTGIDPTDPATGLRVLAQEGILSLKSPSVLHEVYLYDSAGKLRATGQTDGTDATIRTVSLSKGVYFLKVRTNEGWAEEKVKL